MAARLAGIPEELRFQTKPQIALEQIRQAVDKEVPGGLVLADAGHGVDGQFRGVDGTRAAVCGGGAVVDRRLGVWQRALVSQTLERPGPAARSLRRNEVHQPVSAKQFALVLPA